MKKKKKVRENNMSVYALNTLVSYLCNMKLFNVKEEI